MRTRLPRQTQRRTAAVPMVNQMQSTSYPTKGKGSFSQGFALDVLGTKHFGNRAVYRFCTAKYLIDSIWMEPGAFPVTSSRQPAVCSSAGHTLMVSLNLKDPISCCHCFEEPFCRPCIACCNALLCERNPVLMVASSDLQIEALKIGADWDMKSGSSSLDLSIRVPVGGNWMPLFTNPFFHLDSPT